MPLLRSDSFTTAWREWRWLALALVVCVGALSALWYLDLAAEVREEAQALFVAPTPGSAETAEPEASPWAPTIRVDALAGRIADAEIELGVANSAIVQMQQQIDAQRIALDKALEALKTGRTKRAAVPDPPASTYLKLQ